MTAVKVAISLYIGTVLEALQETACEIRAATTICRLLFAGLFNLFECCDFVTSVLDLINGFGTMQVFPKNALV